jgi:hypothetical protein
VETSSWVVEPLICLMLGYLVVLQMVLEPQRLPAPV